MFSRKTAFLIGIVLFVAATFAILTVSSRTDLSENKVEHMVISLISPFQMMVSASFAWSIDIWQVYFATVSAGEENSKLKRQLALTMALQNRCREIELENDRLRRFIDFNNASENTLIAAKVIGRDPSPWFQTIMINKGGADGLIKGLPVLVSEGIVGQTVSVSEKFSRVLLITDRNSSVDALVQSSRARGIVQGDNTDQCLFKYALRKDEIMPGDIIISSGLDQVFPKGLRIGEVLDVNKENSDLFQMILVKTFVDFDKLEEVLVSSIPAFIEEHENGDLYIPEDEENSDILSDKIDKASTQKQNTSTLLEKSSVKIKNGAEHRVIPSISQKVVSVKPDYSTPQSQDSPDELGRVDLKSASSSSKLVKKSLKNASSRMVKPTKKEE